MFPKWLNNVAIFRFHLKDEADPVTLFVSGKGQILDRFLILFY